MIFSVTSTDSVAVALQSPMVVRWMKKHSTNVRMSVCGLGQKVRAIPVRMDPTAASGWAGRWCCWPFGGEIDGPPCCSATGVAMRWPMPASTPECSWNSKVVFAFLRWTASAMRAKRRPTARLPMKVAGTWSGWVTMVPIGTRLRNCCCRYCCRCYHRGHLRCRCGDDEGWTFASLGQRPSHRRRDFVAVGLVAAARVPAGSATGAWTATSKRRTGPRGSARRAVAGTGCDARSWAHPPPSLRSRRHRGVSW
mmetsp:Transcript_16863/g.47320  ORF Transcript_16863/g.47320 Transcript_16863/m.47320 type:complete len:252 (+) Transcript_16863:2589-3344(+)